MTYSTDGTTVAFASLFSTKYPFAELVLFYKDLDECIQDILMLIGVWNAKVRSINDGREATMGKYGYGKRNDRGEALLEFALDNDVVIGKTPFQQKECRKWTWLSPNQHTTNMIDIILYNRKQKTAVQQCRT